MTEEEIKIGIVSMTRKETCYVCKEAKPYITGHMHIQSDELIEIYGTRELVICMKCLAKKLVGEPDK